MNWVTKVKRRARDALSRLSPDGGESATLWFEPNDIARIADIHSREGTGRGTSWDALRDAHMRLPDWFRHGLDPLGDEYLAQQHRLWKLIAGVDRPYDADIDEKEHSWGDIDPVRSPGFFVRRDADAIAAASDHVLATGMLLKHCGLKAGDRALEYGAGFAQAALTLARLGVCVDTVDISMTFCGYVRRQAEFFEVPLTAFHGPFGLNPRPGEKYKLIWFYESFHHCLDFRNVVAALHDHLALGGRIILAGEPVVEREYAAVPYPWGMRLHSEVAAVVRTHHWFELGFSEAFLFRLFESTGFAGRRIECEPTPFGRLYIFEPRT